MAVDRLPTEVLGVEKVCTKCGFPKDLGEFYKHASYADGRFSWCKGCFKERRTANYNPSAAKLSKYSIDFNELWVKQQGLCGVCSEPMLPKGQKALSVVVDHDHNCCATQRSCGKCVRGLIHKQCNMVLGASKDNPKLLQGAVAYLEQWRSTLT